MESSDLTPFHEYSGNRTRPKTRGFSLEKLSISNLVGWKSSKNYFAGVKIEGELIRESLDTPIAAMARQALQHKANPLLLQKYMRHVQICRIFDHIHIGRDCPR